MSTIPLQEAQANLSTIIDSLQPGDEVIITRDQQPIARITTTAPPQRQRQLGTMKGSVLFMAPDFDAPLEELQEFLK